MKHGINYQPQLRERRIPSISIAGVVNSLTITGFAEVVRWEEKPPRWATKVREWFGSKSQGIIGFGLPLTYVWAPWYLAGVFLGILGGYNP